MTTNLNSFDFTSQIGMCGGGGLSFRKESYFVYVDEDGEECWAFDGPESPTGYILSLCTHYTGYKAMAIVGGGREQELKDLALRALSAAVSGDWCRSKSLVNSWVNNPED
jgi:hypothetical protein